MSLPLVGVISPTSIKPISKATATEKLQLELIAPVDGLMYIYIANETNDDINVYFDNLTITHTRLQVVETTDYYPFGMVMRKETPSQGQGLYSRYRYGYQGQYAEFDPETGYNHFELRQYGSRIGRWTATDPYRQYASPYVGMGNNPISGVDPDGAYTRFGSWVRSGFGLRGKSYQSGFDNNGKEVWGFNTKTGSHFGTFGEGVQTLRAWEPNFFGDAKSWINDLPIGAGYIGNTAYDVADQLYIGFLQTGRNRYNLEGFGVSNSEITDAGVATMQTFIPISKVSSPIIKGINASQFSTLFKGTFVARMQPVIRGFWNKQLNKQVVKEQVGLIHGTTVGVAEKLNE